MAPTVVFVTGGNNGIGYEAVKALLESPRSYHVLMGSRSLARAESAIAKLKAEVPSTANTVEIVQLDLTSDDSILAAVDKIKANPGRLDVLVNNAGATFDGELIAGRVSIRECFNRAYDVNVAGTHVLSYHLTPLLLESADPRLLFVAGLSHMTVAAQNFFPTPPQPAGWPKKVSFETIGYRCSKTALNMLMLDWNHKVKADGVKVWAVGPGFLATDLGNMRETVEEMGGGHPSEGGLIIRQVVEGERDQDVGKVIDKNGEVPF